MNVKAEKLNQFLEANMPNVFQISEIPNNELHAVVYQSAMEVDKQNLPFMMVVDDSIYVMFQVRVANGVVKESNKLAVLEKINSLNETYKVFKYYVDENNSIIIESCIPSADETFTPEIVHATINVVFSHLQEEYKDLMKIVWMN